MIQGVTKGYEKSLQVFGAGYNLKVQGKDLVMQVGFANAVSVAIPDGVNVELKTPAARGNDTPAEMTVRGADKAMVGQFAANVRHVRPPEPYLGKGVRYLGEEVKRKVGKAFASGGA
jgi:large subunit ribosomal protein L6